jgi:hypothetical protein
VSEICPTCKERNIADGRELCKQCDMIRNLSATWGVDLLQSPEGAKRKKERAKCKDCGRNSEEKAEASES